MNFSSLTQSLPSEAIMYEEVPSLHMSDVQRRLLEGGVSEEALEQTLDAIEETAQLLFNEQNKTLDDEASLEKIQAKVLSIVVELGGGMESNSLESQFDRLVEDFSEPDSSRARTNVVFAIGSIASTEDSLPPSLAEGSADIIAENHA